MASCFAGMIREIAEASLDCKNRRELEALMKNGVRCNDKTGLDFFTGYEYATLYDWDQYFEGLVQLYMGWGTGYMRNAVKVFMEHQQENGFTKRAINNSALVGIPSEEDHEMVKPFLSQITLLCLRYDGHIEWLDERYFMRLKRSLDYWLFERDRNGNNLSRWRSSIETGMDNQHERGGVWRSDFCEGVDLNAYLYLECLAFAAMCEHRGSVDMATEYRNNAEIRKNAVLGMWDENDGFFYDRDERDGSVIRVKSASGLTPLWAGIATEKQAERLVREHIMNPDEFWRGYPIPALAGTEPGYSPVHLEGDIGCNWRANTWIPTNYMTVHGLVRYGYINEAKMLADKTAELVNKAGNREYFVTETGEGQGLKVFWGWTLLAYFVQQELKNGFNPAVI